MVVKNLFKVLFLFICILSITFSIYTLIEKISNKDTLKETNTFSQDSSVNVKNFGAKGDGVTDDTAAIKAALAATPLGGELIFPLGAYNNTGFTITKPVNIRGVSKYGTRLVNIGTGDSITIASGVERGTIRDISIFGNGTTAYGSNATSGKGIVFDDNSVNWTIDNIWMRGHGDWFFYAGGSGNVNNINIINSEFDFGKKGAMYFVQSNSSNQINAINIENCNFSYFGGNIMELWGQSITVQNNSIQATHGRGVVIDGHISAKGACSTRSIRIDNNYFEQGDHGFVYVRAVAKPYPRYAFGVSITNNYGSYTGSNKSISIVEVAAPDFYSFNNLQVAGFVYLDNTFNIGTKANAILNGNNVLSYDSVVQRGGNMSSFPATSFIGLGRASILDTYNDSGTSTKRPAYTPFDAGKEYFDTTLNIPIWWTGKNWVDSTGKPIE